jgi:VIT1/CCC1 family predicted Fe2+/Mn2+ transporter
VLGANDGIVSTASLVLGVAAASPSAQAVLVAGLAGLAAGALSMAVGEYVSVSSQRDGEHAELQREKRELRVAPRAERKELADIYVERGLDRELARQVAGALMAKDPLAAHARDELHIDPDNLANPMQAALVSMLSFALGAGIPLVAIVLSPPDTRVWATLAASLAMLAVLGAWSARLSGAPIGRVVLRVLVGGALAMGITSAIGSLVGGALPG